MLRRLLPLYLLLWAAPVFASTQPIWQIGDNTLDATATEYVGVMGNPGITATEDANYQIVPAAGVFSEWCIWLSTAPGAGTQYVFTLRQGATGGALSDTAMTITIADTNTRGCSRQTAVAYTAGQRIAISIVPTGTPATPSMASYMLFSPTTADQVIWMGGRGTSPTSTTAANWYHPLEAIRDANEDDKYIPIAETLTVAYLYVEITTDPGTGSWAFDWRDCGTLASVSCADSVVDCSIAAGASPLACNSGGDSLAMTAGDMASLQGAPSSITNLFTTLHVGVRFDMGTPDTFITATASDIDMDDNQRMFGALIEGQFTANASETAQAIPTLTPFVQARSIYAWLSADPGTAPDAYTYTIRGDTVGDGNLDQANDDTACAVTVTANATTGSTTGCTDRIYLSQPTMAIDPNNATQTLTMDSAWGMGWQFLGLRRKGAAQ